MGSSLPLVPLACCPAHSPAVRGASSATCLHTCQPQLWHCDRCEDVKRHLLIHSLESVCVFLCGGVWCVCACMFVCMCACVYLCACVSVCVSLYVRVCVRVCMVRVCGVPQHAYGDHRTMPMSVISWSSLLSAHGSLR